MMKYKNGFSLIELLIVLALFAIVGLGIGIFFTPIVKTYADTQIHAELQNITEVMSERFSEKFRYYDEDMMLTNSLPDKYSYICGGLSDKKMDVLTIVEGKTTEGELFSDILANNEYADISFRYNEEDKQLLVKFYVAKNLEKVSSQLFEYDFSIKLLNEPKVTCESSTCDLNDSYSYLNYK